MYEGKVRYVAPVCIGQHKSDLSVKLLAIYVGGYSKSKFQGDANSDLRMYDLDKIKNAEPKLTDFSVNLTTDYVGRNFTKVFASI